MKKYLVIGKPVDHSLSPQLHNYWIKINKINAIYDKKDIDDAELKDLIIDIKDRKINGVKVTLNKKKKIISYLDELSEEAKITESVNTIFMEEDKLIGHNTDIKGFELSVRDTNFDIKKKTILILGAGGVVPSIVYALNKMQASQIIVSNRTKEKALYLKNLFKKISIVNWGEIPNFDMIINATSVGLKENEDLKLDFSKVENKFFYDVIYNPSETNFLKSGKKFGNKTINGKMMFIYQAHLAFKIWHNVEPKINDEVIKIVS